MLLQKNNNNYLHLVKLFY